MELSVSRWNLKNVRRHLAELTKTNPCLGSRNRYLTECCHARVVIPVKSTVPSFCMQTQNVRICYNLQGREGGNYL